MKNAIILLIVVFFLYFLYRSCTSGYDAYGYYVQARDPAVFEKRLSADDERILSRGRILKSDIMALDTELDQGDGPEKGLLRWYGCLGIDCDEGWEESFLPKK